MRLLTSSQELTEPAKNTSRNLICVMVIFLSNRGGRFLALPVFFYPLQKKQKKENVLCIVTVLTFLVRQVLFPPDSLVLCTRRVRKLAHVSMNWKAGCF